MGLEGQQTLANFPKPGRSAPNAVTVTTAVAIQNTLGYDADLNVAAATAGTVAIAISADNVTWTTLETARTIAASGGPNIVVRVPNGWYAKLTATTSVLGTAYFI